MTAVVWYGVSRRKPQIQRFRCIDGWFGLRVTCWHGTQAELVAPDKATASNWEFYASIRPCAWINCTVEEKRGQARRARGPSRHDSGSPATAVSDFWANLDRDGDGKP